MADKTDIAIIGAGPAGLGAALEAAYLQQPVTLIDAYPQPGGQYYKQAPNEFRVTHQDKDAVQIFDLIKKSGARLINDTSVWGVFPEGDEWLLGLYGPKGTPRRMVAKKVILSPGAYDRPVPFPGWTLPGVMTAGAAMNLIKAQQILPGKRILLTGSGPLQLVLAQKLIDGGAQVVAILDSNPFPMNGWRHAPAMWGQWQRLAEGWRAWQTISRAGIKIRWGYTIISAHGEGRVEQAIIGKINKLRTSEYHSISESMDVDTICLGFGFVPAAQLGLQAGAIHTYQPKRGGFIPERDNWLQTSQPGLFIAGDGAGIGGKDVASWEGRLAMLGAVKQLGRKVPSDRSDFVRSELKYQRRFASILDVLFPFSEGLWDLMKDDTIICRCEEVTLGEIKQAIKEGANTVYSVKNITRAGMGRCQGRMCGISIAHLVAKETGRPAEQVTGFIPHAPVVNVPVNSILEQ